MGREGISFAGAGPWQIGGGSRAPECVALDPGLRRTGWGVVDVRGARISHVGNGVCASSGADLAARLLSLFDALTDVVARYAPDQAAVEHTFVNKDAAGTLKLGQARAMALLDRVGLADAADRKATELSYGKKRALEIATTLALDPSVMLLDEPTAGMGHEDVEPITDLIREVSDGRTILIVEHNLAVVSSLCERITVLQHGEVLTEGDYAAVSADERVVEAYMGGVEDDD